MKKNTYKYCVFKNNVLDGMRFVGSFEKLVHALALKDKIEIGGCYGGGCCDVVKKRFVDGKMASRSTCNNKKYSDLDLYW